MRKKTVNNIVNKILWGILAFLPIIVYLVQTFGILQQKGYDNMQDIVMASRLSYPQWLHDFWTFPVAGSNSLWDKIFAVSQDFWKEIGVSRTVYFSIAQTFTWMIIIEFIHILTDFIMFLPRVIRKFFSKVGIDDDFI